MFYGRLRADSLKESVRPLRLAGYSARLRDWPRPPVRRRPSGTVDFLERAEVLYLLKRQEMVVDPCRPAVSLATPPYRKEHRIKHHRVFLSVSFALSASSEGTLRCWTSKKRSDLNMQVFPAGPARERNP